MESPVSRDLRVAIDKLFDEASVAWGLLGHGVPLRERDVIDTAELSLPERVRILCTKLESYIVQLSRELIELGPEEEPRLRGEAAALLVELREIQSHFPEIAIGE